MLGSFTPQGCWKDVVLSKDAMNKQVTFKASNISSSGCGSRCLDNNQPVFAMAGESCYCANKYPSEGGLVDNSQCNFPCKANATEACGNKGQTRFSVWNTGIQVEVPYLDKKAKNSTSKSSAIGTPTSKKSVKKTTTPASSSEATPTSGIESTTTETEASTTTISASTASTAAAQPSNAVSKNMAGAGVAILAAALAL